MSILPHVFFRSFPGGLPTNLSDLNQSTSNPLFIPMSMPVSIPSASDNPTGGSVLPLGLWPSLNRFRPSTIFNGIYKQNSTPQTLQNPGSVANDTQEETTVTASSVDSSTLVSSLSPVDIVIPSTALNPATSTPPPSVIISSRPTAEVLLSSYPNPRTIE